MKKIYKNLLGCLVILLLAATLNAQSKDDNFIRLKNGQTISLTGEKIKLFSVFKTYLKTEDKTYKMNEVYAYQYKGEYYINYNNLYFLERTIQGKINYYYTIIEKVTHSRGETKTSQRVVECIQKGENGPFKRMNYQNLYNMVKDNKIARKELENYKRNRTIATIGTFGGIAVLFGGFATILSGYSINPAKPSNKSLYVIGGVTATVGLGILSYGTYKKIKTKLQMVSAINKYNLL